MDDDEADAGAGGERLKRKIPCRGLVLDRI
jgi:hypothetical protein